MTSAVDLNHFIIALLEVAYRSTKQATDGLTDEQLYYQPTAESNSMAWLVWHLSRWREHSGPYVRAEQRGWKSADGKNRRQQRPKKAAEGL
jgi:DinB superfamily